MEKKLTFEESMDLLEEIVSLLENNEQPLSETIALFEEGLKLVKSCDGQLRKFEEKVAKLKEKSEEESDED